jgi:hypothetical protein
LVQSQEAGGRIDRSLQPGHGNEDAERCDRGERSSGKGVPKQAGDSVGDTDGGTAASQHAEAVRGPHRDREQRERLREIATLQIALTVLKRPMDNSEEGPEEQAGARDRVRTKMQSWSVTRSLDMIAPEVINSVISHLLPASSMELLTQLVKKWKDWKMSEVDDMVQTQARTNHSQEWAKQRRTFLEEKHGLSLLTGKRKPNVPQVELCEEVPIGAIKLSEMTGADTGSVDKPTKCPREEYPRATSSTIWDEAHVLRLRVQKGKADQTNKIVVTAWVCQMRVRTDRRRTSAAIWLRWFAVYLYAPSFDRPKTGMSPFDLAHGFPARVPMTLGIEHFQMASPEVVDVTLKMQNRLKAAADQMAAAQVHVGLLLVKRATPALVRVGDRMWLDGAHVSHQLPYKLACKWFGPYEVLEVRGHTVRLNLRQV